MDINKPETGVAPKPVADATPKVAAPVPNPQTAPAATPGVYNLGAGEKKDSVLGKLLGSSFKDFAQKKGGSLLGAMIGAQISDEKKAQKNNQTGSIAQLLGQTPSFDPVALEEQKRKSEKRARGAFYAAVVFAVLVFGVFQVLLNPNPTVLTDYFGQNSTMKFDKSNEAIKKTQTDINVVQQRIARMWLDVVNNKMDVFSGDLVALKNPNLTLAERTPLQQNTDVLAGQIKEALSAVQKIFALDLGIDTYTPLPVSREDREAEFAERLKNSLVAQRDTLRGSAQSKNDGTGDSKDVRAVDSLLRLVQNKKVRVLIRGAALKDMNNEDLSKLLSDVRSEGIDEFSLLEKLKEQRIDWSALINNIHDVVRTADPHYGHGLFKTFGGFMFSAYSFDSKTNRVSISGVTRTTDSRTFSFVATLIDAIEKSPYFKDIDFRSFSKTRDESGDFSSGINLEFGIER